MSIAFLLFAVLHEIPGLFLGKTENKAGMAKFFLRSKEKKAIIQPRNREYV